jgi:hypothetical protein
MEGQIKVPVLPLQPFIVRLSLSLYNIYLSTYTLSVYTFLATLLLLLAISSAIVIRSVFLRRRRRRIIQEAIRNGVWPPGELAHVARLGGGTEFGLGTAALARTKDIGEKPKMWEVYLHAKTTLSGRAEETKGGKVINSAWKWESGSYWDDILPLHAALVQDDGNSNEGPAQDSPTQVEEEQGSTWWSRRRRRRTVQTPLSALAWRIVAPHASLPPSRGPESSGGAAEISLSPLPSSADVVIQGEMDVSKPTPVTVAMLISMPRPPPPSAHHVPNTLNNTPPTQISNMNFSNTGQTQTGQGEEVVFPHLELGVAEVVVLPLSDHVDEERDTA